MTLSAIILLVLLLFFVQLFLQEGAHHSFNMRSMLGNRDALPEKSVVAGRLDRAKCNMQEALPLFLGLALLTLVTTGETREGVLGACVFLIARIAYVPAYASGIRNLRSIFWLIAKIGLAIMALPLIRASGLI
ncbi:MAG: MAPEG family protein [Marinomonas sp.]